MVQAMTLTTFDWRDCRNTGSFVFMYSIFYFYIRSNMDGTLQVRCIAPALIDRIQQWRLPLALYVFAIADGIYPACAKTA